MFKKFLVIVLFPFAALCNEYDDKIEIFRDWYCENQEEFEDYLFLFNEDISCSAHIKLRILQVYIDLILKDFEGYNKHIQEYLDPTDPY